MASVHAARRRPPIVTAAGPRGSAPLIRTGTSRLQRPVCCRYTRADRTVPPRREGPCDRRTSLPGAASRRANRCRPGARLDRPTVRSLRWRSLASTDPEDSHDAPSRRRRRRRPRRPARPTAPPAPRPPPRTSAEARTPCLALFIAVPFLALLAAVPVAWGWGLGWRDLALAVGDLRWSPGTASRSASTATSRTARSRPTAPLKIALAVAGSLAIEGPVVRWVADHRRHHAFSDREGDPHSPWRYGETVPALVEGPVLRAHRLAVRRRADQPPPVRARPAEGPGHRRGSPRLFPLLRRRLAAAARRCSAACCRWSWQGAVTALLLGLAGAGRRCCTTSPGRSTRSATPSASGRSAAATERQRLVAGAAVDGRVLAQPAPRRPDLRPARRAARPDRLQRPGDLAVREARLGDATSAGRAPTGSPPAGPTARCDESAMMRR